MIVSAKQYLKDVGEGKWVKVTPEEEKAIIESIPGENLISQSSLRQYVDRDYIVVHGSGGAAEAHPLNAK